MNKILKTFENTLLMSMFCIPPLTFIYLLLGNEAVQNGIKAIVQ